MATLTVTEDHDYSAESLSNIDSIVFATNDSQTYQSASFKASQFGPGLISNSVAVTGDAKVDYVYVGVNTGSFSAAGWTFSNWIGGDALQLYGSAGGDTITGSSHRDLITGAKGADILDGGAGDDTFNYFYDGEAVAGESVSGGLGHDTILLRETGVIDFSAMTLSSIEELYFSVGAHSATFNDAQLGGTGIKAISGSVDIDQITIANAVSEDLSSLTFKYWTAGTDTIKIIGTGADNALTGSSQNDIIDGQGGADTMTGGAGDDWYFVDNADKVIEGVGQGTDRVFASVSYVLGAGQEVEKLTTADNAGTSALTLIGNEFSNSIYGNAGDNLIKGGGGADTLYGFGGDDKYYVDNHDDAVIESVGGGQDRVFTNVSYQLGAGQEIEKLTTGYNDGTSAINLIGNELANSIFGNAGANVIKGGGGTDTLVGLGGDDLLWVDSADDVVIEAQGQGTDRVFASVDYTLGAGVSVETLSTTGGSGTANINLIGNELGQTILGNAGSNALKGMAGNDTLWGGGGVDAFVFNTALDAVNNVDQILDFSVVDDSIVLASWIFTDLAPGTLAPDAFHVGSGAADAGDRIIYDNNSGALFYDADGVGGAAQTLFATMGQQPALTNADFLVV